MNLKPQSTMMPTRLENFWAFKLQNRYVAYEPLETYRLGAKLAESLKANSPLRSLHIKLLRDDFF